MGAINLATAELVETIGFVLDTDGWIGSGIHSPEQWVCWKAGVSRERAAGLVEIARRRADLPACWALFRAGRLTEDQMVRIARRVPAAYDDQVARTAPDLLVSQLNRVLKGLPPIGDAPAPDRERFVRNYTRSDGSGEGGWSLPADEQALMVAALMAARDAEYRDRNNLPADAEVSDAHARSVSWADALIRLASEGLDALDATYQRTGHRGERHQIVLHHHVNAAGDMGRGRLHLSSYIPDPIARYMACEADVIVMAYRDGKLLGINPTERTPNRKLRRYLEHRDGGCAFPLCVQTRWLHAHHIQHWEDGGPTVAHNLVCFCPLHHRGLHMGDFTIEGNPEDGTLTFTDRNGQRIEPPDFGADPLPRPAPDQLTYQQPWGGRLSTRAFTWNEPSATAHLN